VRHSGQVSTKRRRFLQIAGATAAAAAGGVWLYRRRPIAGSEIMDDRAGVIDTGAVVSERRRLGRTGLEISVVGIGAGGLDGPEPIVRAVDKGMNYIDTSICYGDSEKVIRRALRSSPGLRDKLVIATKWDAGASSTKAKILESLDKSLGRLGVDVIDVMQLHWLGGGHKFPDNGFNRLDNPELYLAMEEARRAGKVRFFGATSHAGDRSRILRHAIGKGVFDMLLVKLNLLDFADAEMPQLLASASKNDVGVVVMKSQPGGGRIPSGYVDSRYSIYQANLRWVLEQEAVTSVVHSKIGTDPEAQDLAASAVQEKLGAGERALLDGYAAALSPEYCRGCRDACVRACPDGVAIPELLQFSMVDRDYGWPERARTHYRELPREVLPTGRCASCAECSGACPFGLDAAGGVREALRRLG
jgi:predicted aldo/keto reductase-like oxidoreductase